MADLSVTDFTITSNGNAIDNTYQLISISVTKTVNKIASAELSFRDSPDVDDAFIVANSDDFAPGVKITVELKDDNSSGTVFEGIVVKQTIGMRGEGTILTVDCKDVWVKSTLGTKQVAFADKSLTSAIIKKIAKNYASDFSGITATKNEKPKTLQYKSCDWDLIVSLAEREGMIVVTDNGKLIVAKPNAEIIKDANYEPAIEIRIGEEILDFNFEVDASNQFKSVSGSAWDIDNQKLVEVNAAEPKVNKQGDLLGKDLSKVLGDAKENLTYAAAVDSKIMQEWADAVLLKSRLSTYSGSLTIKGNAEIKPNTYISISGFGTRFDGVCYVSGVNHKYEDGKWTTTMTIGLSEKWFGQTTDLNPISEQSTIPAYQGLQIGVVKEILDDPDNNFRVQVEIPFLDKADQLIWARLSSYYTGNKFGVNFMPEKESEVVLAFINNDPSSPVILGTLYSSKIPPPNTPTKGVDIKTIKTTSGLEISFDDSDKKVILSINTPKGNSIVLSEEKKTLTITDQTGNEIKMAEKEMTITSKSKLVISAKDEVEISSKKVTVSGSDSFEASGGKVAISSKGTAELKASGTMTVKGTQINLN